MTTDGNQTIRVPRLNKLKEKFQQNYTAEKQKFRSFKYKKIFFLRAMAHECQMPAKTSFIKFTDHTKSAKCYTLKLTFARTETCFYIHGVSHSERNLPHSLIFIGVTSYSRLQEKAIS